MWSVYAHDGVIGRGNFGEIVSGHHLQTGTTVAIKIATSGEQSFLLRREHGWLLECREWQMPGVVSLADPAVYSAGDGGVCIILELANTDLMSYASSKSLLVSEARQVIRTLLWALHHLHGNGLVHRDVKPQNVLVFVSPQGSVDVKLADFGLAKQVDFARQNSAGDWGVMSPDVALQTQRGRVVTPEQYKKSDVYAVGWILFFLLTGRPPFDLGEDREALGDDYPFTRSAPALKNANVDAVDLCRSILRYKHFERPDASAALSHSWFMAQAPTDSDEGGGPLTLPATSNFSEEHFDTSSPTLLAAAQEEPENDSSS